MTDAINGLMSYRPRSFGADPNEDPLGIALRQRSVADEEEYARNVPFGLDPFGTSQHAANVSLMNARSDPQGFNTMMQAIKERAPGGIAMPSHEKGDPLPGLPFSPLGQPSTFDPSFQSSSVPQRVYDPGGPLSGLKRAR